MKKRIATFMLASALAGCGSPVSEAPPSGTAVKPPQLHKISETFATFDPGGHAVRSNAKIEGTREYYEHDHSEWFQTQRCDTDGYRLKLPNGRYRAYLSFNEHEYESVGKRVFDVVVQGERIAEKLDIFAKVGKNKAYQIVSPYVEVHDETMEIAFRRVIGSPCIAGISVGGDIAGAPDVVRRAFFQHIDSGAPGDFGL